MTSQQFLNPVSLYTKIKYTISLLILTVIYLVPLIISPTAFSEIYKWTDAQGKTHFSDHPPQEQVKSEEVSSQLSPLNRDSSSDETKKLQQLFKGPTPEEQALQQQEEARQRQRDQQINKACNEAREQLAVLKGPVYFTDDNGNEVSVSEEERVQRVIRLEQEIRDNCP